MTSRRVQKVSEAIREVVSMAILTEVKDPRIRGVTVTYVEVTGDLRQAKVHVSVMGDDTQQNLSLRGLQNSAGFLQSKVAKRIDTRYTPRLEFVLDLGVKRSIEIAQILQRVLPQPAAGDVPPVGDAPADDDFDDEDDDEYDDEDAAGESADAGPGDTPGPADHGRSPEPGESPKPDPHAE
jgi:ribosome-binding factor A